MGQSNGGGGEQAGESEADRLAQERFYAAIQRHGDGRLLLDVNIVPLISLCSLALITVCKAPDLIERTAIDQTMALVDGVIALLNEVDPALGLSLERSRAFAQDALRKSKEPPPEPPIIFMPDQR